MSSEPLSIAYLTAGAAGMFCGSCMHDNTLVRALLRQGVDIQLIPLYTPIRTDEENVSLDRVFYGGINVYLQQKVPLFRWLPWFADRWLDTPALIRWAAGRGIRTEAKELGALTVSMLRGRQGHQRKEVDKLCRWLSESVRPNLVVFTNMLVAGCAAELKRRLHVPLLVNLQGDDVFLSELIEPYRSQAFDELRKLVAQVDGFLVNSRYYADFMAQYIPIPRDKFRLVPLGVETGDFRDLARSERSSAGGEHGRTIGFLARLAPEKGLHVLVDAFVALRRRPGTGDWRLHLAGWLGPQYQAYADEQFAKLRAAGLENACQYFGQVDRAGKLDFLRQLDVLSVPTIYREPKGLYVLEALAAGVPVVQPNHGAFPELLAATGGGRLVPPADPQQLADALYALLTDDPQRRALAAAGRAYVLAHCHADAMAQTTLAVYREFLAAGGRPNSAGRGT